jgi:hypothetical protein
MARRTLTQVEILEQKVEQLETLPARVAAVELQILLLRDEARGEFSAVRQEIVTLRAELRHEFRHELHLGLQNTAELLRAEIRQGDEETRRYMRVLHEDVIARIAALGDARR